ncbi:uncharacterized protein LY79DRAFT_564231 [Colletotrichum navitas]|uniref:Uncharacterized protein n=1 Tax=Colletotrichum navitas TaxID=681940 RepID=A0AAD8PSY9_9PEZI|nr:uncharacterized protein LY79DRAFT_564231 [Colletotrichum navitas]KAK1579467.1 hypothetical protein LY79DRAFT_564231 [Colletotrichum navitas]
MAWHSVAWPGVAWPGLAEDLEMQRAGPEEGGEWHGIASPPKQTNPPSLRCDACNTFPRCECGHGMRLGVDLDQTGHRPNHPSVRLLARRRGGGGGGGVVIW